MKVLEEELKGTKLKFYTDNTLFSPEHIDHGTKAMLEQVEFHSDDKVLDLGCGYGVVGILAAKIMGSDQVVMCDIDGDAVKMARKNIELNNLSNIKVLQSNGLDNIEDNDFTLILSNPPYHADFSVPKQFIEKGFNRLCINGRMYMVTKRKKWYKNKLIAIFGGVEIQKINGYYVFMAEKRSNRYANKR